MAMVGRWGKAEWPCAEALRPGCTGRARYATQKTPAPRTNPLHRGFCLLARVWFR
jgi:hypothetical protein